MKDYTAGWIFCKCSTRMHVKGKHIRVYEYTNRRQKCPNCGRQRKVMIVAGAA